jgi:hypothetical protein
VPVPLIVNNLIGVLRIEATNDATTDKDLTGSRFKLRLEEIVMEKICLGSLINVITDRAALVVRVLR